MNIRALRRMTASFLGNERGSMSIELVVIMPLFMILLIATLTFWHGFKSQSHTAKLAYAVSDIMSRHLSVDNAQLTEVFDLQNKLLPAHLDERTMRISSICFANGNHRVLWSNAATGAGALPVIPLEDALIPVDVLPTMAEQESIILTEVSAHWTPPLGVPGLTDQTWTSHLVTRPRFVGFIPHTTLNPANECPTA